MYFILALAAAFSLSTQVQAESLAHQIARDVIASDYASPEMPFPGEPMVEEPVTNTMSCGAVVRAIAAYAAEQDSPAAFIRIREIIVTIEGILDQLDDAAQKSGNPGIVKSWSHARMTGNATVALKYCQQFPGKSLAEAAEDVYVFIKNTESSNSR